MKTLFIKIWKKITNSWESNAPKSIESNTVNNNSPSVFDSSNPIYESLIIGVKIDPERVSEVKNVVLHFKKNLDRYDAVSSKCGFPSDLLCALHYRESSLSFSGVLHNGEKIINTGRKTKLVPSGRGPFTTWEEAAIDALMMKKKLFPDKWTLANKLAFAEKYNGLGYRKTGELSPYVWAGTNRHDENGKYVADGKYSSNAQEKQLGVCAILMGILEF